VRKRSAVIGAALGLVIQLFAPALVAGHESFGWRQLNSSYYTNGTTKVIYGGGSHTGCGRAMDVSLKVYYNKMDATGMNVTKVQVSYSVKGGGGGYGGTMIVTKGNQSQVYLPANNALGDHYTFYPFNRSNVDSEGYSLVGSYTHQGPVWSPGRHVAFTKYTSIWNCSEDSVTVYQFQW
jgi:hypothetical protein